jgi:FlaA1/EpsC-like NDP-sugar epimerase
MGQGGDVFVLDMGEPVRIVDLARRMVQLSGLTVRDTAHPEGDITIEITGLRPGEKLFEELLIGDNPEPTAHPRIMKAQEACLPWPVLEVHLQALRAAASTNDDTALRTVLAQCVQGFPAPGLA